MKTAIVSNEKEAFLATNMRWYNLSRRQRLAPTPFVFYTRKEARQYIVENGLVKCRLLPPEKIKQKKPGQVSTRRQTDLRTIKTK